MMPGLASRLQGLKPTRVSRYSLATKTRLPRTWSLAMSHELEPKVGRWYRRLDDDEAFKVVSIDEDDGLIEIRTVDGEIEELDSAEWVELDLEASEQPEDYVDPDEDEDDEEEDEEDDRPSRGRRGSRDDWDDDDEDDDWDDDDDDEDDDDYDE
jgi:hypothetical protein